MTKRGALGVGSRGQALIETALVLPFILLLIFGVFEFGRIVFIFSAVNNASREATRYGAATGATTGGVRYLNCDAIKQAAIDTAFLAGLEPDDIQIQYDRPVGGSMQVYAYCFEGTATDISTGNALMPGDVSLGDRIVVTVSRAINPILSIFPSFNPTFVTARTILKDIAVGKPECNDEVDNDGDGKVDYGGFDGKPPDDGCSGPNDTIEAICYRLSVVPVPEDGGTMSLDPGANCANRYLEGFAVDLEAFPDIRNEPGLRTYTFDYWDGPVDTGIHDNPSTVTMNDDRDIIAHFRLVEADLEVLKFPDPEQLASEELLTYTVWVTNLGPDTAHDVVLTDDLPPDSIFQSVTKLGGPDATCGLVPDPPDPDNPPPGGDVVCTLDVLEVGADKAASFEIVVLTPVVDDPSASITNIATASAVEADYHPDNDTATVTTPVVPRAEIRAIEKLGPVNGEVDAGSVYEYTITVGNDGPSIATGVKITDPLPPDVIFDSSPDGCSDADINGVIDGVVECEIGTLGIPGSGTETATVTFSVTAPDYETLLTNDATVAANEYEQDVDNDNTTNTVETGVIPVADLMLTKEASAATVTRNVPFTYNFTVYNDGPSDALSVEIEDALPPELVFTGAYSNDYGICFGITVVTCQLGTIESGVTRNVSVEVVAVAGGDGQVVVNDASVKSLTMDRISENDSASAETKINDDVSLTLTKTGPSRANRGETIEYKITVNNSGTDSTALNVKVVDTLPAEVNVADGDIGVSSSSGTWSCNLSGNEVTCTDKDPNTPGSTLAAGGWVNVIILATVKADAPYAPITNTANMTSSDGDGTAEAITEIAPPVDLAIVKTGPDPAANSVSVNDEISYHITVTNLDSANTAHNVKVEDTLPEGIAFVSDTLSGTDCSVSGRNITCDLGNMGAGAAINFDLVVLVTSSGFKNNTARVDASEIDPNSDNDSDVHAFTVP